MKKLPLILIILLVMFSTAISAYTVEWILTGNVPLGGTSYFCQGMDCSEGKMTFHQTKTGSSSIKMSWTGTTTNPDFDRYAFFLYPQNACYKPTGINLDLNADAYWGPTAFDFKKETSDFCGSEVVNPVLKVNNNKKTCTQLSSNRFDCGEVAAGDVLKFTVDTLAAWGIPDPNDLHFIPEPLEKYYSSLVDTTFLVNSVVISEEQYTISANDGKAVKTLTYIPEKPGTYVLRIATKMDNECKCEGSNYKYKEVVVTVPEGCIEGYKLEEGCCNKALNGWDIKLLQNGKEIKSMTTGSLGKEGYFKFDELNPGTYVVRETMQPGWDVANGYKIEYEVQVEKGDICTEVTFKNKKLPTCVDECSFGDKMCAADELWICGHFDDDECTEWGLLEDCGFTEEGNIYHICVNEDSVSYKDITEGFCNTNSLKCDEKTYTKKIQVTDCGETSCETSKYCDDNDVYQKESCIEKGCYAPTGLCFSKEIEESEKIEDCSENSSEEFCKDENIVRVEKTGECIEKNNDAYCTLSSSTVIIEECGPDSCIEFTEMDPEVFEYVEDFNSCKENGYPYCAIDGPVYDFCLSETILMQPYCDGNNHNFEEFDCSLLTGCYPFSREECVYCRDPYDARCKGSLCKYEGIEYREYKCGSGICHYTVDLIDKNKNMIDDRCEDIVPEEPKPPVPKEPKELTYTPRQALYVSLSYDELQIQPGKQLDIIISVTNHDKKTQNNLRIMAAISGFQEYQRGLIQKLEPGETKSRRFSIDIPDNFNGNFEELKISVTNDQYKRILYRELRLK